MKQDPEPVNMRGGWLLRSLSYSRNVFPFCWYVHRPADIMVKTVVSGSPHSDPSHSHMEEKGGFIDCFMSFHFSVVNLKSEIPFLLKASAGPRMRYIFLRKAVTWVFT